MEIALGVETGFRLKGRCIESRFIGTLFSLNLFLRIWYHTREKVCT